MTFELLKPRSICWPTRLGWVLILAIGCALTLLVIFKAEKFLCLTQRIPAEVLIVEGTLNRAGLQAAAAEYARGGYQYVVTTGGKLPDEWELLAGSSFASMAQTELVQSGVPMDRIIAASAVENPLRRESASAVRQALSARGVHPRGVNLFTLGINGRLDRSIFVRLLRPDIDVGVISWVPAEYNANRWWHSSERARGLISEMIDLIYETFFST